MPSGLSVIVQTMKTNPSGVRASGMWSSKHGVGYAMSCGYEPVLIKDGCATVVSAGLKRDHPWKFTSSSFLTTDDSDKFLVRYIWVSVESFQDILVNFPAIAKSD